MIGQTLAERYKIVSELGRGGMGVVYRASDTLLQREVAVKVVSAAGLGTEGRGRLLQEARAAAGLNHPNIVAVHDVGETALGVDGDPVSFIVMELVEGESLQGFRPKSIEQLADIGVQMCAALEAAHDKGIIHRDLKPENVLLAPELKVKLSDFGLARVSGATRLTREGALVGTVSYLAPEVIQGQPSSVKSDLYALGVILYELAAGRPPFEGETVTAILSQHLHAPVVPPGSYNEELPPEIEQLIVQLLEKRPEKRPTSAGAVAESLEGASLAPATPMVVERGVTRLVRGRLVGREEEFGAAVEVWERSTRGEGQVLLISGEPGIGKTRLARELSTYAELTGGIALKGECYAGGGLPYMPVAQIIRGALENGHKIDLPAPVVRDLIALAPDLLLRYPESDGDGRSVAELDQQHLYESVVALAFALLLQAPLCILVEDIHWADSGSASLVRHLARRLKGRAALIVATYREIELDETWPFQETLADLNRERLAARIKLSRLGKEPTRSMLATLFAEEITDELLEGIYRETEGNPFFIEELSRALVDSGKLYFRDGRWHRPAAEDMAMPQSVRVAIQSRLGRLDREVLEVLQVAALLGREFRYDKLLVACEMDEDRLIDVLETAVAAQLIEEIETPAAVGSRPGELAFTFSHALILTTLITGFSTLRRQRLQRRIALTLESAFPDERHTMAPLLGRYFAEAGDVVKATGYLLDVAERARELFAYAEAASAYEQALLLLREGDDKKSVIRCLMRLGLIYLALFEFDKSHQAYEEAFEIRQYELALSSSSDRLAGSRGETLHFSLGLLPATLDPGRSGDANSSSYIEQLFEGLVELASDGTLTPKIAQSWEVSDDGRRYVFHLRDNLLWSDGHPLSANDFEFAWKRALNPAMGSGYPASLLFVLKGARAFNSGRISDPDTVGVKALNRQTLAVDLEEPIGYFLSLLQTDVTDPVPQHKVIELGDAWANPENLVGNGFFIIEEWQTGHRLVFSRNPHYRGTITGNVHRLEIKHIPDEELAAAYEADELDILNLSDLRFSEAQQELRRYPDEHIALTWPNTHYVAFNHRRPQFEDIRIRQALAMSLEKRRLLQDISLQATPADGFIPPGLPGHLQGVGLGYEPDKARQLLAAAGFPNGRDFPAFALQYPPSGVSDLVAPRIAQAWHQELGLEIELVRLPFYEILQMRDQGDFDAAMGGWSSDYPDPDGFFKLNFTGYYGWRSEEYDSLVNRARLIRDQAHRVVLYHKAEEILARELPVIPIMYRRFSYLVKPWVKNVPTTPMTPWLWKNCIVERRGYDVKPKK